MSTSAILAPPAVFQLVPPYERLEPVPDIAALMADELPHAAVLAVGLPPPQEAWGDAAALVTELRARFPAAPVVMRVEGRQEPDEEARRRATEAGAHGAIAEGQPTLPALRRLLTDTSALSEQMLSWLALRIPSLRAPVRDAIGGIVERSTRFGEVGPLLTSMGHAERTARTWFRRSGLPGPGKWLAAAHAVRAALRLQAEERAPLLTLAVECGYSDHSSLSRQSLRLFGARPGAIRRTLGWEWLMDRWLRRATVRSAAKRGVARRCTRLAGLHIACECTAFYRRTASHSLHTQHLWHRRANRCFPAPRERRIEAGRRVTGRETRSGRIGPSRAARARPDGRHRYRARRKEARCGHWSVALFLWSLLGGRRPGARLRPGDGTPSGRHSRRHAGVKRPPAGEVVASTDAPSGSTVPRPAPVAPGRAPRAQRAIVERFRTLKRD